jgi:GT2 family glycosyltransferase
VPEHSLALRARTAAEATLADELSRHAQRDDLAEQAGTAAAAWADRSACLPEACGEGVTVAVCTRDRSEELRLCLAAMSRISYTPLEILVVDNSPADGETLAVVESFAAQDPRIRYTCEPLPGLSRARNHALEHARYDIVAFTDDDTLTDPDWPAALVAAFGTDPQVVCVTGLVASSSLATSSERYFDARYQLHKPFEAKQYDKGYNDVKLYPYNAGIFGKGANFAVRKADITGLGGFDPLLGAGSPGRGGEDLDIFLRVILAGWQIRYTPAAVIWHRHRTDADALNAQLFAYGHGLGAFVAKHLPDRHLRRALITSGGRHAYRLVRQMLRASRASQLGSRGSRLAFNEVRGVAVGAIRYWTSSWKSRSRADSP